MTLSRAPYLLLYGPLLKAPAPREPPDIPQDGLLLIYHRVLARFRRRCTTGLGRLCTTGLGRLGRGPLRRLGLRLETPEPRSLRNLMMLQKIKKKPLFYSGWPT